MDLLETKSIDMFKEKQNWCGKYIQTARINNILKLVINLVNPLWIFCWIRGDQPCKLPLLGNIFKYVFVFLAKWQFFWLYIQISTLLKYSSFLFINDLSPHRSKFSFDDVWCLSTVYSPISWCSHFRTLLWIWCPKEPRTLLL